ncbi:MAG: hypothetical protein ACYSWO_05705 [Planctomycetota bacterium]
MRTCRVSPKRVILAIVVVALIVTYVQLIRTGSEGSPQERRVRLLFQTDHEALLQAGREILRMRPKDLMKYVIGRPIHIDGIPVPRGVPIPRVIRKLRPRAVLINLDGYIVLHMRKGTANFGVKIYPEGFKRPRRPFRYGHRQLLPGLWYYDYRYKRDPAYNKKIDEIIKTGRWPEPNNIDLDQSNQKSRPSTVAWVVAKNTADSEPILSRGTPRRGKSAKMALELMLVSSRTTVRKKLSSFCSLS